MENNKLIAEFMSENREFLDKVLRYHHSWDWLMPVVEKIESLRDLNGDAYRFSIDMCNVSIENTDIEILGGDFKINTTYKAVVKFIILTNTISKYKEYQRNELIDMILVLAGDEFETKEDYIKLAKDTKNDLLSRLIQIEYYKIN